MADQAGQRYIPISSVILLIGAEVVAAGVLILWLVMGINLVALSGVADGGGGDGRRGAKGYADTVFPGLNWKIVKAGGLGIRA